MMTPKEKAIEVLSKHHYYNFKYLNIFEECIDEAIKAERERIIKIMEELETDNEKHDCYQQNNEDWNILKQKLKSKPKELM